jgi:hypothetical protein
MAFAQQRGQYGTGDEARAMLLKAVAAKCGQGQGARHVQQGKRRIRLEWISDITRMVGAAVLE